MTSSNSYSSTRLYLKMTSPDMTSATYMTLATPHMTSSTDQSTPALQNAQNGCTTRLSSDQPSLKRYLFKTLSTFCRDKTTFVQRLGAVVRRNKPESRRRVWLIPVHHNVQPLYNSRYITIKRRLFRF